MSRIRNLPGAAWVAIGLATGALIVPAAAVAAGNVGIIGSNGSTAKVTTSGSLQVAEATPAAFKEFVHLGPTTAHCTKVATLPPKKGFVLKSVTFDVFQDSTPGSANNVLLATRSDCAASSVIMDENPGSVNATQLSFGPGFAVARGHSLYMEDFNGVISEVYLLGYYVNPKAIRVNTPHAVIGKATAQR